jgi:hypothetical protein
LGPWIRIQAGKNYPEKRYKKLCLAGCFLSFTSGDLLKYLPFYYNSPLDRNCAGILEQFYGG